MIIHNGYADHRIAIVQQGDTTFTVTIELDETSLPLRWGMTVRVKILIE